MTTPLQNGNPSWEKDFSFFPFETCFQAKKSKVSIIRSEFVELTGDHFSAVVLNQLLYWTQRVKDFDLLLEEERSFNPECNVLPRHGWIYKTANDLIEETMLRVSHPTMRKYLKLLVEKGWLDERPHPLDKWNKTTQYRVNIRKLQSDLQAIGYTPPDVYREIFTPVQRKGNLSNRFSFPSHEVTSSVDSLQSNTKNFHAEIKNFNLNVKKLTSNVRNLHSYTYTENTPETTNKEHTQRTCAREGIVLMVDLWRRYVSQEPITLTDERKQRLKTLFSRYFQNNLRQWEQFCGRVKSSPFLMGEGLRKWRVSLDWILEEGNLIRILEGNFDDPETFAQTKEETSAIDRKKEIATILASIKDPIWREWCSQLNSDFQNRDSLSLLELKEIADARFLEVENDRLVWIGSSNKQALDRIETLRLKIFPIIEKTFPNTRTLRTRLCKEGTQKKQGGLTPPHSSHNFHNANTIGEHNE